MRIQNNMSANNAMRMFTRNQNNTTKYLKKLSSGLKINDASDNAAGLTISEKMRSQIRGLEQAQRNADDGISLLQTTEGGLNEIHGLLQRMRELAVRAVNDTNTEEDRDVIKDEITQLTEEIDGISERTEFNGIKVLNGTSTTSTTTSIVSAPNISFTMKGTGTPVGVSTFGGPAAINNSYSFRVGAITTGATDNLITISLPESGFSVTENALVIPDGSSAEDVATIVAAELESLKVHFGYGNFTITTAGDIVTIAADDNAEPNIDNITLTLGTGAIGEGFEKISDTGIQTSNSGLWFVQDLTESNAEGSLVTIGNKTFEFRTGATMSSVAIGNVAVEIGSTQADTANSFKNALAANDFAFISTDNRNFLFTAKQVTETTTDPGGTGNLKLQIGANSDEDVSINIYNSSASSLGVNNIKIDTYANASDALSKLDSAIGLVSGRRADLGAMQNRLEHIINNLSISSENTTNSESKIRDADMAKEMMEFAKNNILVQVSQAMISQANQQPQAVLKLLS